MQGLKKSEGKDNKSAKRGFIGGGLKGAKGGGASPSVLRTSRVGPDIEFYDDVLLNIREGALTGLFMESFTPTGNEYQEYLNAKER